jgi:site-specific DNA-adenine methylase
MKKYGFSYQGSKSTIAQNIINTLPSAENFYDLFAGGCAITHCALESNKWQNVIANDIQNAPSLFLRAIKGEFKNEKRWISRERFFKEKDKDPYIRWIWSFGNNGQAYLFGRDIENLKKEAHIFLFENGYDYTSEKRVKLIKLFKKKYKKDERFELQQLEQLERLERLQQLEQLQQLERPQVLQKDYKKIKIKASSVVYCDIPYNQKKDRKKEYYGITFDTKEFYEWAKTRDFPVYFSSVSCDDPYFNEVWSKEKVCLMNNKNSIGNKKIIERLFWNKKGNNFKTTLF